MQTRKFCIQEIEIDRALNLRHLVLWPEMPRDFSRVTEDENAMHLGIQEDATLICVASLYEAGGGLRLRKFATLPEYQGKGFGSAMMHHVINLCAKLEHPRLWLSARESAMPFYEKFGFEPFGDPSTKASISYRFMERHMPNPTR